MGITISVWTFRMSFRQPTIFARLRLMARMDLQERRLPPGGMHRGNNFSTPLQVFCGGRGSSGQSLRLFTFLVCGENLGSGGPQLVEVLGTRCGGACTMRCANKAQPRAV